MHVDFLHNQRNTNICTLVFAWNLDSTWAWHSISVYISFAKKNACNIKFDFERQVRQSASILDHFILIKIPNDLPHCFPH